MKLLRGPPVFRLSLLALATLLVNCAEEGPASNDGSGQLCSNTCEDADDGFCDDGGEDSDYDVCTFGSDCRDCGPRTSSDIEQPSTSGTLHVENQSTNLSIGAVSAGPCGSAESKPVVFQGQIFSGSSETISLPPGCYDVTAGDAFFQRSHEQFDIVINANSTTTQGFSLN
jgi:hypothetical protein